MFVECRHIMPRGAKCKSPALRGRPYCYYHDQLHTYAQDGTREKLDIFCLPSIEDANGIQLGLMQVMNSMANGRLDSREGVRLIYGLQVALQALDRVPAVPPQEIVQSTACDGVGIDIAQSDAGLGEPHPECSTCSNRYSCINVDRQNKKSLRDLRDDARDQRERAEREPLALPASSAGSVPDPHEQGLPEPLPAPSDEKPSLVPEQDTAPSCPDWSLDPYRPTTVSVDPLREAELEARINKFRPNRSRRRAE